MLPPEPPSKGRGTGNADRVLTLMSMMAVGPVMILVDTGAGVMVPGFVRKQHGPALPLLLAWNQFLEKPILDLMIDDKGIRATLSFGGKLYPIVVPWNAIWRMYSEERNILYGECVPPGIVAAVQNHKQPDPKVVANTRAPGATNPHARPELTLVPMPEDDDEEVIEKSPARLTDEWPPLRLVPPLPPDDEPPAPSAS